MRNVLITTKDDCSLPEITCVCELCELDNELHVCSSSSRPVLYDSDSCSKTATIRSRKSSAGIQSNLNPASKEMISESVELWETEVCFFAHPT